MPQAGAGNTPQTHPGPQTFPVSMQHNPVTKTGFSGENMDINMDLNVGSPSGSTGSAQCPRLRIPAVHPLEMPRCPYV